MGVLGRMVVGIHVDNGAAYFVEKFFDVAEEEQAVCVAPPGTRVREMPADVPERHRAQYRVANGMREGVTVRVSHRTFIKWDCDPA